MTGRPSSRLPIIVRGNPTDEEIAAVVAILAAVTPTPAPDGPPPRWQPSRCWTPDSRPGQPGPAWARRSADRAAGVGGNFELMPARVSGDHDDLDRTIGAAVGRYRRHDEPICFGA